MGLIPVELDINSLYEDHDRRRRKNGGSEKSVSSHVSPHVHSVCRELIRRFRARLITFSSVGVPKIVHRNEHSGTGKRSI